MDLEAQQQPHSSRSCCLAWLVAITCFVLIALAVGLPIGLAARSSQSNSTDNWCYMTNVSFSFNYHCQISCDPLVDSNSTSLPSCSWYNRFNGSLAAATVTNSTDQQSVSALIAKESFNLPCDGATNCSCNISCPVVITVHYVYISYTNAQPKHPLLPTHWYVLLASSAQLSQEITVADLPNYYDGADGASYSSCIASLGSPYDYGLGYA